MSSFIRKIRIYQRNDNMQVNRKKGTKNELRTHRNSLSNVDYVECRKKGDVTCPLLNMDFSLSASMTVEASLVLPLFLIATLTILSLVDVMRVTIEKQMDLHNSVRQASVYAAVTQKIAEGRKGDYIRYDRLIEVPLTVQGFGLKRVYVRQRCMVHIFNGYDASAGDRIGRDTSQMQELVYITEEGSVYHTKRSCPSLQISIRTVQGTNIEKERNIEGKIYRVCTSCMRGQAKDEIEDKSLYISAYGVKYHASRNCSELKRTIRAVSLENVGGRPPCRRCG